MSIKKAYQELCLAGVAGPVQRAYPDSFDESRLTQRLNLYLFSETRSIDECYHLTLSIYKNCQITLLVEISRTAIPEIISVVRNF